MEATNPKYHARPRGTLSNFLRIASAIIYLDPLPGILRIHCSKQVSAPG